MLLLASLAALALAGCAGYRLGPSSGMAAGTKSIQVDPFANQTFALRLGEAVTAAVRKGLQRDGTYRLATRRDADIVVTGEITRYNRLELSYQPDDILTVRDVKLTVTAHVTARERGTSNVVLDCTVTGETPIRAGPDLTSAERQALPLLAEDLSKKVTSLLVDGRW